MVHFLKCASLHFPSAIVKLFQEIHYRNNSWANQTISLKKLLFSAFKIDTMNMNKTPVGFFQDPTDPNNHSIYFQHQ
jgi:hypothetical protein